VLPSAVALFTLRSIFDDGYLIQVDAVFGPRPGPLQPGFAWPVSALEAVGTRVFGGDITGRLYAVGALFLVGFAAMTLLRNAPWYAQCLAGLLAMLNPWVYDRMADGQWGLVVAAAGLFLWIGAWETLQRKPGPRSATALALAGIATVAFDAHALILLVILSLAAAIGGRVWQSRERVGWTGASFALTAVGLLYGAIPSLLGGSGSAYGTIRQVGAPDFAFFKSTGAAGNGLALDLVGLYGYWGEQTARFPIATNGWNAWPVAAVALTGAAVAGAFARPARAWLLAAGATGLLLSASTALPDGVSAASWLDERVPVLGAFREPQKASVLWLLALVVLGSGAVAALASAKPGAVAGPNVRGRSPRPDVMAPLLAYLLVLATLLPAGYTELRALSAILEPVEYPASWARTAAALSASVPRDQWVLVLPWHLYQPLPFAGSRLTANPAPYFFPGRLIVPDDIELPGRYTESRSHLAIALAAAEPHSDGCPLARAMDRERIRWALVLDTPGGRAQTAALSRCGFATLAGGRGGPWLLRRRDPAS